MTRGGVEDTRLEAKTKDTKKFRGQGQGQTLSRPRTKDTDASVLQKKKQKKQGLQNFFSGNLYLGKPKKNVFPDFPQGFWRFPTKFQRFKIVLSSSRGQGSFGGLEASRPRPRTSKCVLEAKNVLDSTSGGVLDSTSGGDL